MFDAVVLSDIHLGSSVCRTGPLKRLLRELPATRRLVINGDLFESTDLSRLPKAHWKVLSLLRRLSEEGTDLIWVEGNHDPLGEDIAHLIGAAYCDSYAFESGGRHVLCVHGHQWDDFITSRPVATWAADLAYGWLQKASPSWARAVKRSSKTFVRCCDKVRAGALAYAERHWADLVLCGHTHEPEVYLDPEQNWCVDVDPSYREAFRAALDGRNARLAIYANSGCWTEEACHYLTVLDGAIRLEEFHTKEELQNV